MAVMDEGLFAAACERAAREVAVWRSLIALPWDAEGDPRLEQTVGVLLALAYAASAAGAGQPVGGVRAGQVARLLLDDPGSLFATRPAQIPPELWAELIDGCDGFLSSSPGREHDLGTTSAGGRLTVVPVPTPTHRTGWQWGRCYARALMVLHAVEGAGQDD